MPMTNFPRGFAHGLSIRGVPLLQTHPGEVVWLSNSTVLAAGQASGSNNNPGTFQRPMSTLAGALDKCLANRGDIIFVKPGHAETISSATALALDVAGVAVIGLGTGTKRPTFTLDTANTATIAVSVANVSLVNLVFSANFADIAALFTLTTAKNFLVDNCEIKATATNMNFLAVFDTSVTNNDADGLTFSNSKWIEPDAATKQLLIGDADVDSFVCTNNYFNLGVNASDLPVIAAMATGKDLSNMFIADNYCVRLNDANPLLVTADTTTANTGVIARNFVRHADTAGELLITAATNVGLFENKASAVADYSGYTLPAVDS